MPIAPRRSLQQRLGLVMLVSMCTLLTVPVSFYWSGRQIAQALERDEKAEHLVFVITALQLRLHSVVIYGQPGNERAWAESRRELELALSEIDAAGTPARATLLRSVSTLSASIANLYGKLSRLSPSDRADTERARLHLVDRMFADMATMREDALRLSRLARVDIERTLGYALSSASLIAAVLVGFATWLLWSVAGQTRRSVNRLRAGMKSIADGDLHHRITHLPADELGELGEHFNKMAQELADATAHRDTLMNQLEGYAAALSEANVQLELIANTDSLTGLSSRWYFFMHAERELKRAQRHRRSVALLMFDLDEFKEVNDRYGHLTGDAALAHVGAIVRENLRAEDLAGRYGGDEFVALLPETALPEAIVLAERILANVNESPLPVGDHQLQLGLSIGIGIEDSGGTSIDALIERADRHLLGAKKSGRNRVYYPERA